MSRFRHRERLNSLAKAITELLEIADADHPVAVKLGLEQPRRVAKRSLQRRRADLRTRALCSLVHRLVVPVSRLSVNLDTHDCMFRIAHTGSGLRILAADVLPWLVGMLSTDPTWLG